jgi:hypothetical protein
LGICKLVCILHQAHDLRFKDEMSLLEDNVFDSLGNSQEHELRTAPIMTRDANVLVEQNSLTQYGVLGKVFCRRGWSDISYLLYAMLSDKLGQLQGQQRISE